jgi:heme exporter protein A
MMVPPASAGGFVVAGTDRTAVAADAASSGGGAIAAREVWRGFGRERILRGLSLDVPAGAGLAVFGPNGSGKSTLLRVLAGLLRPSRGTVVVGGENLFGTPAARRRIGYVGHEPMLYGGLTIRENLTLYATLYRLNAPEARIEQMVALLGLGRYRDTLTARLSRGLAQRAAVARALLHAPAVLLLDEPFAGLDPDAAAHLAAHLDDYRRDGGAFVLATHHAGEAARTTEEARILRNGRLGGALRLKGLDAAAVDAWYRNGAVEAP